MGEMFEDMPDLNQLHILERVEDYHVGFYIAPGKDESTVMVYDILTGFEEQHLISDVRLLPQGQRIGLDNDEFSSRIRELVFMKHDHVLVDAQVSTDPDTEMIYDYKLWNIVSCDGNEVLIEAGDGSRLSVDLSLLERSRQERVGPSYTYREGEPLENDGFVTTPGGFGTGDWVWYFIGHSTWELSVVHIINGDDAVIYCTMTGRRLSIGVETLIVASRDDSDTFNRVRDFALFRRAAIEGGDTQRLKIPHRYSPLTVVKDPKARHEPKRGTETSPFTKNSEGERPVKTQETVEYFDSMEEAQQKYNSGEFSGFVEDREEETYGIGAWPARWRKI